MPENINLSTEMEKQLPAELVEFMRTAGEAAASQGQSLYLVGGMVRDLLLSRTNLDLDLVVEGDAISLAQRLADVVQGKLVTHPHFNTAKLRWKKWSVDIATARSETYERPGALPTVKPDSLDNDLFRRDFTINAMALELNPTSYGRLLDPYGGRSDLEWGLIRVLHGGSFIDDSTRIWRGLRYEQRLDFQLEPTTLLLLLRDIPMLGTISGDRLRHELELILKEEFPEKVIRRAKKLRVLPRLHRALRADGWLAKKLEQARELSSPNTPSVELYMALLTYRMTGEATEELISKLRLQKSLAQILRDTYSLKGQMEILADPKLARSRIYHLLRDYSPVAITAISLAANSVTVRRHIETFLTRLRYVKPALTGDDLQRMGIPPGPRIKETLQRLHEARLDRKVRARRGEVALVREWVSFKPPS